MNEVVDKLENLTVIKRNGKKVSFDETKIALSIKKGFDSVEVDVNDDDKERKYTTKDVQKVYQAVLKRLEKLSKDTDKIKIEEQDKVYGTGIIHEFDNREYTIFELLVAIFKNNKIQT